jgi:hypothetical protein
LNNFDLFKAIQIIKRRKSTDAEKLIFFPIFIPSLKPFNPMKKLLSLSIAFALVVGLSSCTKDYNCTCVFTNPGDTSSTTLNIPIANVKKSDAEDACSLSETTYRIVDPTANCTLE